MKVIRLTEAVTIGLKEMTDVVTGVMTDVVLKENKVLNVVVAAKAITNKKIVDAETLKAVIVIETVTENN